MPTQKCTLILHTIIPCTYTPEFDSHVARTPVILYPAHSKCSHWTYLQAISICLLLLLTAPVKGAALECQNWQNDNPDWLWCDDFESEAALDAAYFEVNRASGLMTISNEASFGGTNALRSEWVPGGSEFGNVKLSIGRTPVSPTLAPNQDFSEIYWRFYTMIDSRWSGPANKTSRITIFSKSNWSQAAIGHLWMGNDGDLSLSIDPASGVGSDPSSTTAVTNGYNDFNNLSWLGLRKGNTQIFHPSYRQRWVCVETRVKLNSPGNSDGVFEFWVDDGLEASRTDLNWRSSYQDYGLNAIFLENYRGNGPAQAQARFFDNFVVSTSRIGCLNNTAASIPKPPVVLSAG